MAPHRSAPPATAATLASPPPMTAPGPRGSLLMGSLGAYQRDPMAFFSGLAAAYGDVARFRLGPFPAMLVSHPEGIAHVIQANNANYGRGRFYEKLKIFFGHGLLTMDGDDWRDHRTVAQPAFLRSVLGGTSQHVAVATQAMLDRWEGPAARGEVVRLAPECMGVTLAALSRTLFGLDVSDERGPIIEAVDFGVGATFNRGRYDEFLPSWVPTARSRGIRRNREVLNSMIERIRTGHRPHEASTDLVTLFEGAVHPGSGLPWDDREVVDELMTIFLAGQETTSMALMWTMYLLARHPEVHERLRAEADGLTTIDPAHRGDHLRYTRMVLDEALRLYPPIWMYVRDSLGPDVVQGFDVPTGTTIIISPYVTHRRPDLWDRPDIFDPDRFDPQTRSARHRFAYLPFGGGPRQCIGQHMALHELQIILPMIVQRFDWSLVDLQPAGVGVPVLSLRPGRDIAVRLTRRCEVGGAPSVP